MSKYETGAVDCAPDRSLEITISSVRTFLHVRDAINAYLLVLDNSGKTAGEIYNVGSNDMNHSKEEIGQMIKNCLGELAVIESELSDPDRRNFVINFDKLAAFGFKPTITLAEGIDELFRLYRWYRPFKPYQTI